ncbi:hypothetical protein D4R86_02375 [bacterium]|nr:MAG: hypothetical protein D4R86_02375 [bacterium]
MLNYEEQTKQMNTLLQNIKNNMSELEGLLEHISGHWRYEDLIYRYYHHSFKVYFIQQHTEDMVALFLKLCPNEKGLNNKFVEIFEAGRGKSFKMEDNQNWNEVCAPMVEAFLHAKFFLEMIVKYGKQYEEAPDMLESGWAAVLILYGLR